MTEINEVRLATTELWVSRTPLLEALIGLESEGPITRLRILAEELSSDTSAHSVVTERVDEWHGVLLSGCRNQSLLDLTESINHTRKQFASAHISFVSSFRYYEITGF